MWSCTLKPGTGHLRSYGRTKARGLKPRQAALVETLLPHVAVPEEGAIDLEALFCPAPAGATGDVGFRGPPSEQLPARGGAVVLEIGFGGGEHLVAQAVAHPEARFIGVEPFLNGVASCLRHIEEQLLASPLAGEEWGEARSRDAPHPPAPAPPGGGGGPRLNIRLHHGDAREVMARLPHAALDLVYILFPDPWPKARHHKRRLIQPAFLDALARVLKPGAEVRFATDWANYAEWTLWRFLRDARFSWLAERADDWRRPWPGHVPTRYEQKRLGDCKPVWLRFALR